MHNGTRFNRGLTFFANSISFEDRVKCVLYCTHKNHLKIGHWFTNQGLEMDIFIERFTCVLCFASNKLPLPWLWRQWRQAKTRKNLSTSFGRFSGRFLKIMASRVGPPAAPANSDRRSSRKVDFRTRFKRSALKRYFGRESSDRLWNVSDAVLTAEIEMAFRSERSGFWVENNRAERFVGCAFGRSFGRKTLKRLGFIAKWRPGIKRLIAA